MLRLADRLRRWAEEKNISYQRTFWPLLGIAFLFTLAAGVLLAQNLRTRASQVNVAGRQRMYIQKMAKDALAVTHHARSHTGDAVVSEWERAAWDLPATMAHFQEAQRWLLEGTHRGTPMAPVSDPQARRQLQRVSAQWDSYRDKLEVVLADEPLPAGHLAAILAQSREIGQVMDTAVARLEMASHQGTRRRRLLALSLVGGVLVILLLGAGLARAHFRATTTRNRLNRVLDEVPDLVFYKDHQGAYLGINPAFQEFVGKPAEQIRERTDFDLFDAETAAFFREMDNRVVAAGEPGTNTEWVQYPDGQWVYLDMLKAPMDLGKGRTGVLGVGRDLTVQKRAEEHRERLAAVVEAAPYLICFSDPQAGAGMTYMNPAGRSLVDLPPEGGLPGSIFEIYPEWGVQKVAEEAIPTVEAEGMWRGELAIQATDDTEVPVAATFLAFRGEDGYVHQLSTILHDIRPQKQAEEAWRRMAVLEGSVANSLIDAIPGIFYLFDQSGQLYRWNDRAETLTGLTSEEIRSRHPLDFFPEAEQEILAEAIERAFREGLAEVEATFLTSDGPVPFYFRSERIVLEGIPYLCGMGLDISRIKALEEEQRLLARAFHTHQALMITDAQVNIERVNPAFTAITGYSAEEALGANPRILSSGIHDGAFFQQMWQELTECDRWEGEIWNRRRDGEVFPAWEAISVVRDEAGRLEHYVALLHDITERKEAEAERDRLIEILEATPDFIGMVTPEGNVFYRNRSAWAFLGYGPGTETAESSPADSHPDWAWRKVRDEGFPTASREGWWAGETALLGPKGEDIPVSQIILAHFGPGGELQRFSTIMRDLSEQKALQAELEHMASHDPLTGLLNRRPFQEALAQETHRAQRYDQAFALIMLDIDHFKAINDTYGHEIGDRILEELTNAVSDRLREADLLARWGGEEFMALLPETDEGGAREVAEAIRRQVAEQEFPGVGHLTISLGTAEYRAHEGLKDFTKRVDDALYAAKRAGRDQLRTG